MVMRRFMAALLMALGCLFFLGFSGVGQVGDAVVSGGGGATPQREIKTLFFATDPTVTHALAGFASDLAAASDTLTLGTGEDVPEFAWVSIDSATAPTTSVYVADANRWQNDYLKAAGGNSFTITDTSYTRLNLLYVDWLQYIPAGATILSAEIHKQTSGAWYTNVLDTVCCTLMTNEADDGWFDSKSVAINSDAAPNLAHSNWSYKVAPIDNYGYPATGEAWEPALATRAEFEDWGDVSDWTSPGSGTLATGSEVTFSIKNCVQAAVNGVTNNGIMTYYKKNPVAASLAMGSIEPRTATAAWTKIPWITVTYSTEQYEQPFPDGDFVFVFSTDDGKIDANEEFTSVFNEFGWNYSAYYCKTHFTGSANSPTAASMLAVLDAGNEVGSHSVKHLSPYGIANWDANGMAGAEWDSLIRDTRPEWMYTLADSVDGYTYAEMEANPYFGKSFALPNNQIDQEGLFALVEHGYTGFRGGIITNLNATGGSDLFFPSIYRAAVSDSFRASGTPGRELDPIDMFGVPYTISINDLVGAYDDTTITEAQVKFNFKRACRQQLAMGTNIVSTFCHALKNGGYVTDGMDGKELRWLLEVVEEMGGTCMRLSDYQNWRKAYSRPVATPAAYSQIDSFSFEIKDGVWFLPTPETRLFPFEDD